MNSSLLSTLPSNRRAAPAPHQTECNGFRTPAYECQVTPEAMKITVYIPGVHASGVEIEGHGTDLTVTALRTHFVRVNFNALHLERAQQDYRLRLRLGTGFDFAHMAAEMAHGVLTVTLPKRTYAMHPRDWKRVA